MSRRRTALGGLAVLALAGTAWIAQERSGAHALARTPDHSLARRLAGPFASLAATLQWSRADHAFGRDDLALGLARAERAIALDPHLTSGWNLLASHLGMDRASPLRESSALRRLAYLRAALAAIERGVDHAREPEQLVFLRGLLLALTALRDPELPWPGGPPALWNAAADAYADAARRGHPDAAELAHAARTAAEEAAADATLPSER